MKPYAEGEGWTLYHGDCRAVLPTLSGIDAIVTDPPYGIGYDEAVAAKGGGNGWRYYGDTSWDQNRPDASTFSLILKTAPKCLIWGGNYFADLLPPSMGWLAWDKGQRDFSLADFELAWTTEQKAARCIDYSRSAAIQDGRFQPGQKPVQVMVRSLEYLDHDRTIGTVLDPFCGSGSTGVACLLTERRFVGIEADVERVEIARRRIAAALNPQTYRDWNSKAPAPLFDGSAP